jgi:uncharacterized Ntn-hydrolase superfamily protein
MKPVTALVLAILSACATAPQPRPPAEFPPVATFSIVAFDPATGDLGVAVQSKFFGVGSVVPFARAGVGAVATQAFANTTYGPEGLDMLAKGISPGEVVATLTGKDEGRDWRQVGIVDGQGRATAFTGEKAMTWAGHRVGEHYAVQGNILAGEEVVKAMAEAFENSAEPLPERLVAALAAGQAAGGDRRGMQSAALLVVREGGGYAGFNDRWVDLRVEDSGKPIEELARLLGLHRKFYPATPPPADLTGFAPEPEPDPAAGPMATPRTTFETFRARFLAGDYRGLHALYCEANRADRPIEEFVASIEEAKDGIRSFLESARYEGTRIRGDTAGIAFRQPGSPRPTILDLVRESGEWRLKD